MIRQFELVEQIGTGSMGIIWRAVQTSLDRAVAIKELHPLLAKDQEFLHRFEREAKTAGTLQHENIVGVIDYGQEGDTYFLALEFVDGTNLEDLLADAGELPVSVATMIAIDVLNGLYHAHKRGITHRDIKPANIMLTTEGMAKVADFSIATAAQMPSITQTGAMMGTPAYMSPEQVSGRALSGQTDLFSLGVILWELCTGKRPFEGDTYPTIISNLLNHHPRNLHELDPKIPAGFARVVERALEKDVEKRYQDAQEFLEDLKGVVEAEAIPARRDSVAKMVSDPHGAQQKVREDEARYAAEIAASTDPSRGSDLLERARMLDPEAPEYDEQLELTRSQAFDVPETPGRRKVILALVVSTLITAVATLGLWQWYRSSQQAAVTPTATPAPSATELARTSIEATPTVETTELPTATEAVPTPTVARDTTTPRRTPVRSTPTPTPFEPANTQPPTPTPPPTTVSTPALTGPGTIRVNVPSSWAVVHVDGKLKGTMSAEWITLEGIPSGPREIRLANPELDAVYDTSVEVEPGQTYVVRWNIHVGYVRFKTPAKLRISTLSGRNLGTTDGVLRLSAGKHTLRFQRPGCDGKTRSINVSPGGRSQASLIDVSDYRCR